ncbi:MAG: hypothetical protein J6Y02_21570 [Pseudobutyrivibrio sp.]|nr:hypothetical protein [Pseudobutyrivibrio sp.]
MNNTVISSILSFIGGAAISGFVVWRILEPKYKKIADEEIASVKEKFTVPKPEPKKEEAKDEKTVAEKAKNKPNIAEYAKKLKETGYVDYSGNDKKSESYPWQKSDEEVKSKPRVIEPEEFEENEEYDSTNLTFYADGILAYDDGKNTIVDDVESLVGDALEHIGDYEDDSVHVVNDELEMYYEILVDPRKYEEATKKKPHLDDEED